MLSSLESYKRRVGEHKDSQSCLQCIIFLIYCLIVIADNFSNRYSPAFLFDPVQKENCNDSQKMSFVTPYSHLFEQTLKERLDCKDWQSCLQCSFDLQLLVDQLIVSPNCF
jgi:hypothetical protein